MHAVGAAGAGALFGQSSSLQIAGEVAEIHVSPVSAHTVRISILPIGAAVGIADDGSLAQKSWGPPAVRIRNTGSLGPLRCGNLVLRFTSDPLVIQVETKDGQPVQQLSIDVDTGSLRFRIDDAPLLGLGEGGPQFDRRGDRDEMRSGQGGYRLRTHGGRVPIPWLIGTGGWALFVHAPSGTWDLTGTEGRFQPGASKRALPLDVFLTGSREPAVIMAEYARLTGHPEMPPLWSFGYLQSHRTLASREEILAEAQTFRNRKLPCDGLIFLGTGFCPSGWNTANGSFSFNPEVFPDPKEIISRLHADHFRVVLHVVIQAPSLHGAARDVCHVSRFDEEQAGCYWDAHRKVFSTGVDGWWPDEGDPLDIASRLTRNRMYWEGPQIDRPAERPFALHRNGYAGMQRYGSFLWSGDVYSTWETLRTHIPIGINAGLSGMPYWGTDIGGFVPTKEFTGELYVRWFQFGAFCPLFRAHGRTWKLRLPWGWNMSELGPNEVSGYGEASNPPSAELHNAAVEPICRKYLELRYRLLPYLYSAVRECHETGMPIIRAMWLHYPDDPAAVARGDQYLWGRDILVAPVVEKGAVTRTLYLPRGVWYDFQTGERIDGGREISRPVDLAALPLYVRAGAVIPMGPVKQYTSENVDDPLRFQVWPGADGTAALYDDDGISFACGRGDWMGIRASWNDAARVLTLKLAEGSVLRPRHGCRFLAQIAGETPEREVRFIGKPIKVRFPKGDVSIEKN